MEKVLMNVGSIIHVKLLSEICMLEFGVLHHKQLHEMALGIDF
jgi:hypothetical protein